MRDLWAWFLLFFRHEFPLFAIHSLAMDVFLNPFLYSLSYGCHSFRLASTPTTLFLLFFSFSPFVRTAPAPLCNIVAALVQVLNIVGHAVQTIIFLPVARSHIFCSWWLPAAPLSVKVCTAVATPVAQWWHSHHSVKTRECDRTRARHHSSQVGVVSTRATRQ